MAYALDNPVKKISQMGPSNSLWYYTDGDAIGTIDDDENAYDQADASGFIKINSLRLKQAAKRKKKFSR